MNRVRGAGTRTAEVRPGTDPAAAEVLAEHDDRLLAALVHDRPITAAEKHRSLAEQTRRARVHPVYFGSAITGAGLDDLRTGLTTLLPVAGGDPAGPLSGTIFKVDRGPAGEKLAYARLFSGTLHVRDRPTTDPAQKVTAIDVLTGGGPERATAVTAGHLARLHGLATARIGDPIGTPPPGTGGQFAPPSLHSVVEPADPRDRDAVHAAPWASNGSPAPAAPPRSSAPPPTPTWPPSGCAPPPAHPAAAPPSPSASNSAPCPRPSSPPSNRPSTTPSPAARTAGRSWTAPSP